METKCCYEVWVQPERDNILTVEERGPKGEISWLEESAAIEVAKNKKKCYPHMDFLVTKLSWEGWGHANEKREIIYQTKSISE